MRIQIVFEFSSPIGESIFSTKRYMRENNYPPSSLVPYRGIYFLYQLRFGFFAVHFLYSRPLSGNLFSLPTPGNNLITLLKLSSPIGESIFSTGGPLPRQLPNQSSRPLSGNLFSLPLPLEPLCLSGFQSCFAGQNLKFVFLLLFPMLAVLFPLF